MYTCKTQIWMQTFLNCPPAMGKQYCQLLHGVTHGKDTHRRQHTKSHFSI